MQSVGGQFTANCGEMVHILQAGAATNGSRQPQQVSNMSPPLHEHS